MDTVAAGLRAEIDDRIADACRLGVENLVVLGDADRHGVDENIAVVARCRNSVEPPTVGTPKAIAIGADPGNDAARRDGACSDAWRAEAQQVQAGDRTRAHREDVAQNAADAGRGALKTAR